MSKYKGFKEEAYQYYLLIKSDKIKDSGDISSNNFIIFNNNIHFPTNSRDGDIKLIKNNSFKYVWDYFINKNIDKFSLEDIVIMYGKNDS